ncbi:MAG: RrF2 family transcriptional regulator [Phycisphaerales bacterium]
MLSQTCEYALRAVACLAQRPGEFVTASDLADATSVPSDYLSKVLQQLAGADVVQGRRGVGGGYRLARKPEDITFYDIVEAMGIINRLRACPTHGDEAKGLCPLHKTVDQALEAAENVFRAKTLADLISEDDNGTLCVNNNDASTAAPSVAERTSALKATSTRRGSDVNIVEDRIARASTNGHRSVDDEFDDTARAARAPEVKVSRYTASGKLKARPRRIPAD